MYGVTKIGVALGAALCAIVMTTGASTPAAAGSTSCLPGSLKSTLSRLQAKFGHVSVISTHRTGATIAGTGRPSYHASCRAVDFNAPSGRRAEVIAWLRANHHGGLGIYSCGMNHIHIDNGPSVQWNKCVDGGGYASRSRRARRYSSSY